MGLPAEKKTIMQSLTGKTAVSFLVFALIVIGGFTTVNNAISFGRQQDYQPEQPIKFSHATHAGVHKIDCQFCHDGARRSKQSVIPSANTCMNCHKAIKKGTKYGTEEITKIYASIGFDPNTDKFIENYDNLSEKQVTEIYKKWIGSINEGSSSGFFRWVWLESDSLAHGWPLRGGGKDNCLWPDLYRKPPSFAPKECRRLQWPQCLPMNRCLRKMVVKKYWLSRPSPNR